MNAFQIVALNTACLMHSELLADEGFAGYDGSKDQFDRLFEELSVIARDEIHPDLLDEENLEATFYVFQEAVAAGDADADWFEYR